jgi:hypothetical protein
MAVGRRRTEHSLRHAQIPHLFILDRGFAYSLTRASEVRRQDTHRDRKIVPQALRCGEPLAGNAGMPQYAFYSKRRYSHVASDVVIQCELMNFAEHKPRRIGKSKSMMLIAFNGEPAKLPGGIRLRRGVIAKQRRKFVAKHIWAGSGQ